MRFILFALVLLAGVLGGCAPESSEAPRTGANANAKNAFPRDDLGREVNLKASAKRVVCIGPGATETIYALGAGAKLVGRDQISDYPKETSKIPVVGDYTGPFVEKVIAVKPDLVIVQGETYDKARADNWQNKIGVPVVVLVPTSVEKVAEGIKKISKWIGAEDKANNLVWPLLKPRRPHWEIGTVIEIQRSPLWIAGRKTLVDDVFFRAGFYNRGNVEGYKQINIESLSAMEPYYLYSYTVPMTKPSRSKALAELSAHPLLSKLACIKKKRVVAVDSDLVLRPGPRLALGIEQLGKQAKELYRVRRANEDKRMR